MLILYFLYEPQVENSESFSNILKQIFSVLTISFLNLLSIQNILFPIVNKLVAMQMLASKRDLAMQSLFLWT